MESATTMEVFQKELLYSRLPRILRSMGGGSWRGIGVQKESQKTLPINTLLSARAMACNGAHYDSHHNVSTICYRKCFVRLNFVALSEYKNF